MPEPDSTWSVLGIVAVFVLVAANAFFVAAEFALVAVRRSRVVELANTGHRTARILLRSVDHLDANLAATQLGITLSSLALGWIGEPALAHLIEPLLSGLPDDWETISAHGIAIAVAFAVITALHIVLGELAPKSLALQRSEGTALWVVRPLGWFLLLFRPAILVLNGLGNFVLRMAGLRPGAGEQTHHSSAELKLLVEESRQAGVLQQTLQEVVSRVLDIGDRRIGAIMTQRLEVEWIDVADDEGAIARALLQSHHDQLLVGQHSLDEPLGMVVKQDLLAQLLRGERLDLRSALRQPLVVHEATSIAKVIEEFKRAPVRLAMVVDEYGGLQGVVTQTDLLEAIAGGLPQSAVEEPAVVRRDNGSFLVQGWAPVHDVFPRLGLAPLPPDESFNTIAGFALSRLGHLPHSGESFVWEKWRFEIVDMDGRRIDKLLAEPADVAASMEHHE